MFSSHLTKNWQLWIKIRKGEEMRSVMFLFARCFVVHWYLTQSYTWRGDLLTTTPPLVLPKTSRSRSLHLHCYSFKSQHALISFMFKRVTFFFVCLIKDSSMTSSFYSSSSQKLTIHFMVMTLKSIFRQSFVIWQVINEVHWDVKWPSLCVFELTENMPKFHLLHRRKRKLKRRKLCQNLY